MLDFRAEKIQTKSAPANAGTKQLARVYDTEKPNEHKETFIWAVWPYHQLGNVGSAPNVVDARFKAEQMIEAKKPLSTSQ